MSEETAEVENEEEDAPPRRRAPARVASPTPPDEDDEYSKAAPFLDRTKLESDFNSRSGFDFPGRPAVDLDREINNRNRLYGTVAKLRYNDEAKVVIERLLPETWEGVPTKGYSGEYHVNAFQTAADLLEQIKRVSGGYLYECVFSAPNKGGEMKTLTRCKVHINAPPVVVTAPPTSANGNGHHAAMPNPNMELVGKVFETQQKMIDQTRKDNEDPRMFAQVTNIVREMRASSEATMATMMKVQQTQIENLTKMLEKNDKPDAGLIKFTSEQASNERNQIQSRFDMEKTALTNLHQQQLDNLRRDHQMAIDNIRRDKESEVTRMTSQISSMQNQQEMVKLSLETNFNTQLNNLRTTYENQIPNMKSSYENQISNMKSSYDMQMQLNLNRISTLESQVKTLESQRDQLMMEKISDAKNRPDSLSAMAGTMAAVKELAGVMGMQKDQGSNEPEFVSTIKALKEIGIGEQLGKIADRFTGRVPQQQPQLTPVQQIQAQGYTPMGTFNVPVNAQGQPLVSPQQAFGVTPPMAPQPAPPPPQQHAAPPAPQQQQVNLDDVPAPQRSPRAAEAASPLPDFQPEAVRPVAAIFERAMNEAWPIEAFAIELVKDLGRDMLISVVNAGSAAFLEAVEKVVPDSDLTSVKGTSWLQAVFEAVRRILSQPVPDSTAPAPAAS